MALPWTDPSRLSRRAPLARRALVVAILLLAVVFAAWFALSTIPRQIVFATGTPDSYHAELFRRYQAILARNGVALVERQTSGSVENARLLADPAAGVDVGFVLGGVAPADARARIEMLAALYYAPLWVFYRGDEPLTGLDGLRYKRVAIGARGLADEAFVEPLLKDNNVTNFNSTFVAIGGIEAVRALQAGRVDAIFLLGSPYAPAVFQALHDKSLRLMSARRSEAYARRYRHITALTLPPGAVDFGLHIPEDEVRLYGTVAMLAARTGLPPALADLLVDAAREVHAGRDLLDARDRFPNADPVDLPVSADAARHLRFGPSLLQRHLPFFVATYVERMVVLLLPLLFLVIPLINWLPRALRWHRRSRVYRWYGELALLERDVGQRQGALPIERWLADLDRIDRAVSSLRLPASMASEGYTLREHVALVRSAIQARAEAPSADGVGRESGIDSRDRLA
jgi:TRAP-type uncharacterized transport system substrate-binding protein